MPNARAGAKAVETRVTTALSRNMLARLAFSGRAGTMRGMMRAAALAAAVTAMPAWAQGSGATAAFKIDTVSYAVPIPAGLCLPTSAKDVESANYAASLDKENVTLLTLYPCDGDRTSYLLVKTPTAFVSAPVTLATIIDDPYFAAPREPEKLPQVEQTLENAVTERTGKAVEVTSAVRGMGHDDLCGYIGGTVSANGGAIHVSLGGCMTVVGGRALTIFFYAPGNDPATVQQLMAKARKFGTTVKTTR